MRIGLVLLIAVIVITITINPAIAWNDCPKNLINDPYPGECNRYIDTDNDGICDHSQPPPEERIAPTPSSTPGSTPTQAPTKTDDAKIEIKEKILPSTLERYNVIELLLVSTIAVIISEVITRFYKNTRRTVRYIWNVVLLVTSSLSAIFGFLLLLVEPMMIREYNMYFWHVEFSIVATVVGIYHTVKRYKYFLRF